MEKTDNNLYKEILLHAVDGIIIGSPDGIIVEVNISIQNMLGYDRNELVGKHISEIFPKKVIESKPLRFDLLNKGEAIVTEREIKRKNGESIFIEMHSKQMPNGGYHAFVRDVTKRKQTEELLKEFQKAVENSFDAIGMSSPEGKHYYQNKAFDELFGYSFEEVSNISPKKPFYADENIHDEVFNTIMNGGEWAGEVKMYAKGQKLLNIYLRAYSIKNDNNEIIGLVGLHTDITKRKQAEQSLQYFQKVVEYSSDAIGMSNPEGVHYYQNKAFDDLFGLSIEEIASPHPSETIYANKDIGKAVFNTVIAGGEWIGELKMIGKNKKEIDVFLRAYSIKDESNNIIGLVGMHTDITERKRIESELDNHIRLLTTLLESLPIGVFMVEATSGKPLVANEAAKELLGRGILPDVSKENIGVVYKAYKSSTNKPYPPDEMPIIRGMYGLTTHINDMIVERPDGKRILLEVSGCPIYDNKGNVTASLVTFIDITEKQKLLDSAQRADKLESLGILAGGIAHDFNNLLGGIYGLMNMASSSSSINEIKEFLNASLSTMNRARGLTQQLLTFAKGGAPQRKTEELFPFIKETAEFALSGSNVGITFNYPENLWPCIIDRSQISQVIENIIINAQQAMPAGGNIQLTAQNISLANKEHPELKSGNYVKISIKDSGIGIPKEIISRIFDPFFTTKIKGHGLGLATCYSIINRHGGFIDVDSDSGQGSSFHLFLPASTDEYALASDQSAAMHKGKGTFLLMDDQKVIRDTVGAMLRSFGYSVVLKNSGEDAIDFVKKDLSEGNKITAMIFDLTIPGCMGGKDAIAEIRKISKEIPVFVASGYADDPVMADPKKHGFTDSISKPFTMADLATVLNKNLGE